VTGFAIVRDEPAVVTSSVKQWLTDFDDRHARRDGGQEMPVRSDGGRRVRGGGWRVRRAPLVAQGD
jgi:hypothetical protein